MPLVDDKGIDIIVRRKDGTFIEVQVKARSKDVINEYRCFVWTNYTRAKE